MPMGLFDSRHHSLTMGNSNGKSRRGILAALALIFVGTARFGEDILRAVARYARLLRGTREIDDGPKQSDEPRQPTYSDTAETIEKPDNASNSFDENDGSTPELVVTEVDTTDGRVSDVGVRTLDGPTNEYWCELHNAGIAGEARVTMVWGENYDPDESTPLDALRVEDSRTRFFSPEERKEITIHAEPDPVHDTFNFHPEPLTFGGELLNEGESGEFEVQLVDPAVDTVLDSRQGYILADERRWETFTGDYTFEGSNFRIEVLPI